jgi:hypothetical protein
MLKPDFKEGMAIMPVETATMQGETGNHLPNHRCKHPTDTISVTIWGEMDITWAATDTTWAEMDTIWDATGTMKVAKTILPYPLLLPTDRALARRPSVPSAPVQIVALPSAQFPASDLVSK